MKLKEARVCFKQCQDVGAGAFMVRRHCWVDHPKRAFTQAEVLRLLLGKGHLKNNHYPSAKPGSFLWTCKDDDDESVEIAVIIEEGKIKAIAISAYRNDKL
ncbi:MAG: hypothetical protein HRU09_20520 [Oligoflexales bacterium]|nr:hypothetical protein [Oligoflexales bacterium]